jgi:hypothetical protein
MYKLQIIIDKIWDKPNIPLLYMLGPCRDDRIVLTLQNICITESADLLYYI